jgi:peptidoglycan/LPS O-acetylase OafA/YrhL
MESKSRHLARFLETSIFVLNGIVKPFGKDAEVFARVIVLAMIAVTCLTPTSLVGRLLELAPMRWVGRLSYSLYLWQQI